MRILIAVSAGAVITLLAPGLASANPPAAAPTRPAVTVYVAEADPGGDSAAVIPIPAATGKPGTPIKVHVSADPALLAATPDGTTVYLVDQGSGTVTPIDTATNTAGAPIPVGSSPSRHRDHAGQQDRIRRQPGVGDRDPDRYRDQHGRCPDPGRVLPHRHRDHAGRQDRVRAERHRRCRRR